MSKDDLISVIIPTCDRPQYVEEAIESVINQTLQPIEILVMDNGYKPYSYNGPNELVNVVRLEPRCGVSVARNKGARLAKGKYLSFLDDDDWWDKKFLEEALKVIESQEVKCIYGRKDKFINDEQKKYKEPTEKDLTTNVLFKKNPGTGGINLLIEKKIFLKVGGFDENLKVSEDRSLAIDLLLDGYDIKPAPKAISIVRHHNGERLRHNESKRFRFYNKYRNHLGLRNYLKLSFKSLKKIILK